MRLFVAFVENGGIIVLSAVFIDRFILRPRNWVWHLCRSTRDVYAALTIVLTNKHIHYGHLHDHHNHRQHVRFSVKE